MMDEVRPNGGPVIFVSYILAFILTVLPLPEIFQVYRPEWAVMVTIYWVIALPHRIGVIWAWVVGLMLDLLEGGLLGQHGLSVALVAAVSFYLHLRIRVFPIWQQCIVVMVLVGVHQLACFFVDRMIGRAPDNMGYWLPCIVSAFFWPWIMLMLRNARRHYSVR